MPFNNIKTANNKVATRFVKNRDIEYRKAVRAIGDASRRLAKLVAGRDNGAQDATQVFAVVAWQIFVYCRDYYCTADDNNSESDEGATDLQMRGAD